MTNQSKRVALVDGDFIAYRCAASCEPTKQREHREERFVAIGRANDLCNRIGDRVAADEYRIFLGGTRNFRKELDPSYKANRANQPRPVHLDAVRDHLVRKWGAEIVEGYEADDRLAMEAKGNFIIVAIDKDLLQIPGEHYNPVKDQFQVVDDETAKIHLYTSMLIGDSSDNLRGIDGLGPVKSARELSGLSAEEAFARVNAIYEEHGRDFLSSYRMFRLLRSEEEYLEILNEIAISKGEGEEVATDSEGHVPEALQGANT